VRVFRGRIRQPSAIVASPHALARIGPEARARRSIAFDTTGEGRLNQQVRYDLLQAEGKRKTLRAKPLTAQHGGTSPDARPLPARSPSVLRAE
jgi:hypothetical protein